jgi:hypothetical protein
MKNSSFTISIFCLLVGPTGCSDNHGTGKQSEMRSHQMNENSGDHMIAKKKIVTRYDHVDILQIPEVIPFGAEQREYIIELFSAIRRVVEGHSKLEDEERTVLGGGRFFWPKDPVKEVMVERYYLPDEFRMHGISLQLMRADQYAPWTEAQMTLYPRNFPKGAYDMQLPSTLFDDFLLEKVVQEDRPDERVKKPVVFYFTHKSLLDVHLRVESRRDLVHVDSKFPSSFHALNIVRQTNH